MLSSGYMEVNLYIELWSFYVYRDSATDQNNRKDLRI